MRVRIRSFRTVRIRYRGFASVRAFYDPFRCVPTNENAGYVLGRCSRVPVGSDVPGVFRTSSADFRKFPLARTSQVVPGPFSRVLASSGALGLFLIRKDGIPTRSGISRTTWPKTWYARSFYTDVSKIPVCSNVFRAMWAKF